MATTSRSLRCLKCGSKTAHRKKPVTIEYKSHKRQVPILADWCTKCSDGILEGPALMELQREEASLRAEVDQVLPPERVTAVRKKLGLSQREAGELLGGGIRAFHKYESGSVSVSVAMTNLLLLLEKEPRMLKHLRVKGSLAEARE